MYEKYKKPLDIDLNIRYVKNMKNIITASIVATLILMGCGQNDAPPLTCFDTGCSTGSYCSKLTNQCELANGVIDFTIADSCASDQQAGIRYFDETNGVEWPADPTQVFTIQANGQSQFVNLACIPGATVCYGAEPLPTDGTYWGVGVDNNQVCAPGNTCCFICNTGTARINLVCN